MSRRSRTSFSSFSPSSSSTSSYTYPYSSASTNSAAATTGNPYTFSGRATHSGTAFNGGSVGPKPRHPAAAGNLNMNVYQRTFSRQHTENVPKWVHILPASSGLWNMIKTLRERGNHDLADKLELAAEQQAAAHLKTEQLLAAKRRSSRTSRTSFTSSAARSPREPSPQLHLSLHNSSSLKSIHSSNNKNNLNDTGNLKVFGDLNSDLSESERRLRENERDGVPGEEDKEAACNQTYRDSHLHPDETISLSAVSVELCPPTPAPRSPPPEQTSINLNIPPTKNPNSCYHHRLTTYQNSTFRWNSPSPSELAEAGFYFIGPKDCVQCFACETCQKHWKTAEDPWVRHTRRSPSCDYIIETRGQDFIAQILSEVKQLAYSRNNSNGSNKGKEEPEFTKMKNGLLNTQAKLRNTKTVSSSGWRLDPYKERNVGGTSTARKNKAS